MRTDTSSSIEAGFGRIGHAVRRLAGSVASLLGRMRQARRRRADTRALMMLDDRLLADLGLKRATSRLPCTARCRSAQLGRTGGRLRPSFCRPSGPSLARPRRISAGPPERPSGHGRPRRRPEASRSAFSTRAFPLPLTLRNN